MVHSNQYYVHKDGTFVCFSLFISFLDVHLQLMSQDLDIFKF